MSGLDLSQSELAEPPLPTTDAASLTITMLDEIASRVAERAAHMQLQTWSWGDGVLLLGLLALAGARGQPAPILVRRYIDHALAIGVRPGHVNDMACGAVAAQLYASTADARYRQLCLDLLDWLNRSATRATNGAIEHWPQGVWADTAFMAGTFMMHCSQSLGLVELMVEAGRQLVAHGEILQHPKTFLYAHGSHRGETIWCFWGRANAWTTLAGVEYLERVGGGANRELQQIAGRVRENVEKQLTALCRVQPEHGVWDVLVDSPPETRGIVETSAAFGIAAAMLRAASLGIEPERFREAAWRALAGLHAYVAGDGTITRTSAGTVLQLLPFGYSVIRNDRIQPWGQGLALFGYAAALEDRRITSGGSTR